MLVIADTSPLNYLILIDAADVLPQLYETIVIPNAVSRELQTSAAPAKVREWVQSKPLWLEIQTTANVTDIALGSLDAGEREAIELYAQINADFLLIDERRGRAAATMRGIKIIGTIGILDAAAEKHLLDLPTALSKLRQTSFRVSETLANYVLRQDAERRRAQESE